MQMQIQLGYELIYECPQPTPMLLVLNIHHTRVGDLVVPDRLVTDPLVPIRGYRDGFGNWCNRIVAPAGQIRLSAQGVVNDAGEAEAVVEGAQQHPVEELPDDTLVFLLGSRYCETDRLSEIAWSLFAAPHPGGSGYRRSAIMCTVILFSDTSTRGRVGPPGKVIATAPGSAAITPISRSRSVAA
jgi:transglutaminase-like putative cysteine protease